MLNITSETSSNQLTHDILFHFSSSAKPPRKKIATILLYMIINCKGNISVCGLHGYSLASVIFLYIHG